MTLGHPTPLAHPFQPPMRTRSEPPNQAQQQEREWAPPTPPTAPPTQKTTSRTTNTASKLKLYSKRLPICRQSYEGLSRLFLNCLFHGRPEQTRAVTQIYSSTPYSPHRRWYVVMWRINQMLMFIQVAPSRRFLNFLLFTEIQASEGQKRSFFQHFS